MIDWLKYTKIYFTISLILIAFSLFSLITWKLNLGVDFTGGSNVEYRFDGDISTEDLTAYLGSKDFEVSSIQRTTEGTYLIRLAPLDENGRVSLHDAIDGHYEFSATELQFESVGPSIGPELVKKTLFAIAIAATVILLWVAYQFRSIKFGAAAILAMFHDTFILVGLYAAAGKFFAAEVDFLFVTAVLTTLSFSVHDTIVVFDRIREIMKKEHGEMEEVSNRALTETMVRSLNNSFTIVFMLLSLLLLGGSTVKWFAGALMIGTILGTYSSPFVAVPLLNVFDKVRNKK